MRSIGIRLGRRSQVPGVAAAVTIYAIVLLMAVAFAGIARADVRLTDGSYHETTRDLSVKVLGGYLNLDRTWMDRKWYFNRRWAPLVLHHDSVDGSVKAVERNGDEYTRPSAVCVSQTAQSRHGTGATSAVCQTPVYRFGKRRTITPTDTGYRWQDLDGDWIDYDQNGRILRYGNRNNVTVSIAHENGGRITSVFDHHGNQGLWFEYDESGQLTAVRDRTNRRVQYEYTNGQLTQVIDVLGHEWLYAYNALGYLVEKTDPEERKTTISYNATGMVTNVKDQDGIGLTYEFHNDTGRRQFQARVTSAAGRVNEYWYDREGYRVRHDRNGRTIALVKTDQRNRIRVDSRGKETVTEYDDWDNPLKVTYPDGASVRFEYDRWGNVTRQVDANGNGTVNEYDDQGSLIRRTEAVGVAAERITEYTYDQYGQLLTVKGVADEHTAESVTTVTYDDWGNLLTLTDPEGGITTSTYDVQGNAITRTDPRGKLWRQGYDPNGQLVSETDPLNRTTGYTYDKVGNLLTETDARNNATTHAYDFRDNRISTTDPLGNTTRYQHDNDDYLIAVTDARGHTDRTEYDMDGRLVAQIDAVGNRIEYRHGDGANGDTFDLLVGVQYPTYLQTFEYDQRGRRTVTIDHLSDTEQLVTRTEYDANNNLIAVVDAGGRRTAYRYDALDRQVDMIDADQHSTFFAYDDRDNLIAVTNPNGNTTRYGYDRADRKVSETLPLGQVTSYVYDAAGNLTQTEDPDSRLTLLNYDDAGQLIQRRHYLHSDDAQPERNIDFTYDANGNLLSWDDGAMSASSTYDPNNRQLTETTDYGPFAKDHTFTYDAVGNKVVFTNPEGDSIGYVWDPANRIQRIDITSAGSINYATYRWIRPERIIYPGGSQRQLQYDAFMRPKIITATDPANVPLMTYGYVYDSVGNIAQKTTDTLTYEYGYDELDRLTSAVSELEAEGWDYDPNGNRSADNLTPGSWVYSGNDELEQSPTAVYLYDNAGNRTRKSQGSVVIQYTYNAENRLSLVTNGVDNLIAEFAYDPLGRRIKKTTPTETVYFHYNDEGLVGEYQTDGTAVRGYGYTPYSIWTSNPLYQKFNGEYVYYQNDHLGTPQKLIKANGIVVWEGRYRAFGEVTELNGGWVNALRFPGQYFDQESGLHYNYFRYYDPANGRYIISDPIGLEGGINTYLYATGSPIIFTDSFGLAVYLCKKPLPSLGGGEGNRTGPETEKNPFFHQWSCVVRDKSVSCGGQQSTDGRWWGSPGKKSKDSYIEYHCGKIEEDDDCFEKCLISEWKKPRPWYALGVAGPWGTDCQEYDNRVRKDCRAQCDAKKQKKNKKKIKQKTAGFSVIGHI